jgi:hypothetical protein
MQFHEDMMKKYKEKKNYVEIHFILNCKFSKAKQVVALVSLVARAQPHEGMEVIFSVEENMVEVVDIQVATANITIKLVIKVKILTKSLNVIIVISMVI